MQYDVITAKSMIIRGVDRFNIVWRDKGLALAQNGIPILIAIPLPVDKK